MNQWMIGEEDDQGFKSTRDGDDNSATGLQWWYRTMIYGAKGRITAEIGDEIAGG